VAPEETVDLRKQRRVVLAALAFLAQRGIHGRALRFDVVAITGGRLLHLENAFEAGL
jgi:Holliday junction resolvase-like predicted endonuclease